MPDHNITTGTRLDVPYSEKEAAKRLGAKWNSTRRFWYAPSGSDLSKFTRWLPKPTSQPNQPARPTQPAQPTQPIRPSHTTRPATPEVNAQKSVGSIYIWPIVIIAAYLIFQLNYKHAPKPQTPPSNGQLKYEYYQSHGYRSCYSEEATGTICVDGWESDSSGPGSCSHHGGVKEYICPAKIEK